MPSINLGSGALYNQNEIHTINIDTILSCMNLPLNIVLNAIKGVVTEISRTNFKIVVCLKNQSENHSIVGWTRTLLKWTWGLIAQDFIQDFSLTTSLKGIFQSGLNKSISGNGYIRYPDK